VESAAELARREARRVDDALTERWWRDASPLAMGCSFPVAATLAVPMTQAERQPVEVGGVVVHVPVGPRRCVQGAPTSPGICNALVHKLDRRLAGLGRRLGWTYTRYADDLAFPSDDPSTVAALVGLVRRIVVHQHGAPGPAGSGPGREGT
jgi:RNA-directed DNA polymerase